jgi:erythromycin esterase
VSTQRLAVPPAQDGSYAALLHHGSPQDKRLIFGDVDAGDEGLEPRGHRAIGVVYRLAVERAANYVPTVLPLRYDAFLYLDQTTALHPLHLMEQTDEGPAP